MTNQNQFKKPSIYVLILLFLIFIIPVILAWIFYDEGDKIAHDTTNRGALIQPPKDMSQFSLQTSQGQSFDQKAIRGKWLMLYVLPTRCDDTCNKNLFYMRQIRTATGKESDRVQRVLLTFTSNKKDPALDQKLTTDYAGTLWVVATPKQFQQVMGQSPATTLAMTQGYLYLVDPLGNIMMGYSVDAKPSDIFKDLQKLLRVSQIG